MNLHKQFGLRWAEELECEKGVYLRRWVLETPLFSLRLHHWLCSDDSRSFHDHPWWFLSFIFRGAYDDVTPSPNSLASATYHKAPSIVFRRANHKHWVNIMPGEECWTFLITGSKTRRWGFWILDRFIISYRYFYRFGKHPCD